MTTTLDRDQVTITPCACGRLVRLATRWEHTCTGCGQDIPTGAVGPLTWDDCRSDGSGGHNVGTWSHQHGCGAWNSPLEVTIHVCDYGSTDAAVGIGLADLAERVAADKDAEVERIRAGLADLADRAVAHLPEHVDDEDGDDGDGCEWDCPLAESDQSPGAWVHDGVVTAWAWDPTTGGDGEWDTIEIERAAS